MSNKSKNKTLKFLQREKHLIWLFALFSICRSDFPCVSSYPPESTEHILCREILFILWHAPVQTVLKKASPTLFTKVLKISILLPAMATVSQLKYPFPEYSMCIRGERSASPVFFLLVHARLKAYQDARERSKS